MNDQEGIEQLLEELRSTPGRLCEGRLREGGELEAKHESMCFRELLGSKRA